MLTPKPFSVAQLAAMMVLVAGLSWKTPGLAVEHNQTAQAPPVTSITPVTQSASIATEITPFSRSQWQLTETEWQRYLSLMQGIRGSISPKTLSPLEVLGVHAETAPERKKYARLWAKMMHDDVQRTLDFQRAYTEADKELYGDQPLFDKNLLAMLQGNNSTASSAIDNKPQSLVKGDRLLVFVKAAACQPCTELVKKALSLSANNAVQVDVYFTDTRDPQDNPVIISWAKQQQLDTQRLKLKNLTLNHDKGTYLKISKTPLGEVPAVYILRNNQIHPWAL